MFIGHYAPALVAATWPRAPRLGMLFVAAQLVDVAFFGFTLIGIEHVRLVPGYTAMNALDLYSMPFTHSLLGSCGWAAAFALGLRLAGARWSTASIGALVVVSHWLIDWLVHVPDLTLAGTGARYGLGLWQYPFIAMPLELAFVALALTYYANHSRAVGRLGQVPLILLSIVMLVAQGVDWFGAKPDQIIDPPPPALALTALAAFAILALLAAWVGAGRTAVTAPAAAE